MALCLRVPFRPPPLLKYRYICRCSTWTRRLRMKDKFTVRLSSSVSSTLEDKINYLGKKLSGPYLALLNDLTGSIPKPPSQWLFVPGWTRYSDSGTTPVEYPHEDSLVFDVEVCVKEGFYPTLATAVSASAWYLWVSPQLILTAEGLRPKSLSLDDMISLGCPPQPRIIVGHFISYDRARIKENYAVADSGTRYFDTLSAHTCVSGVTTTQRNLMYSSSYENEGWRRLASPNSLSHISEFYCGITLDKSTRDTFVNGSLEDIAKDFQNLSSYCAEDVIATHRVFCELLPLFLERQPHPVSLSGWLEMSIPFFPLSYKWKTSIEKVETAAKDVRKEQYSLMLNRAKKCFDLAQDDKYRFDPWMWDLDWKNANLQGKMVPGWFRDFYKGCAISLSEWDESTLAYCGITVPKILRLRCGPYPLHYISRLGWGVIVPQDKFVGDVKTYLNEEMPLVPIRSIAEACNLKADDISTMNVPSVSALCELINPDVYWRESSSTSSLTSSSESESSKDSSSSYGHVNEILISDRTVFRRLSSYSSSRALKNPLGLGMSKGVTCFNSMEEEGKQFLAIRETLMPWSTYGARWKQLHLMSWQKHRRYVVLPLIEVCADYMRTPRERTWSPLLSLQPNHIGSDLLKKVRAPSGYVFIAASVDNLDLWLASIIGDRIKGSTVGSTKFSSYFLSGVLFETIASELLLPAEEAKCLCHAVVAGADTYVLSKLIYQSHVDFSWDEAFQRASRLVDLLIDYGLLSADPGDHWPNIDGDEVRTPILGARLSRPMELEKNRARLRAQWIIYSSKVDFLHLLVTYVRSSLPHARLCFVDGDNCCLYFLVPDSEQSDVLNVINEAHRTAQSYCTSSLGFPTQLSDHCLPINITVSKNLRQN